MLLRVWPELGRGSENVKGQLEGVIKHPRNHSIKGRTRCLETWISIYLNEPRLEILIYHKIQAKNFESWWSLLSSQKIPRCLDCIPAHGLELRNYFIYKISIFPKTIEILLKVLIAELVSLFILPVFLGVSLDGIVSEVNELVLCIVELELKAARSNVSLFIPISPKFTILCY